MKATSKILLLYFMLIILNTACDSDDESIVFLTDPPEEVDHKRGIFYVFEATSSSSKPITYTVAASPWVNFNQNRTISGIPGWNNLARNFRISITASDGTISAKQVFDVKVTLGEIICKQDFGDPANSDYILPYNVGESYSIWQSYCHPQFSHKNWFSYDFRMPMGTEILASRAGTVIFERDNFADGTRVSGEENFVFIQHSDGTVVHYIHIMKGGSLVSVGQRVAQGEIIALSGDSGGSAGPHLHTTQFIGRTSFNRQYSITMNYRNAEGILDQNQGLVEDVHYRALPF